ncbi:MAG: hypothetical protein IBX43_03315 [Campylobacterales bacterium]|nr:hypothetical protein [Campylobacterales bacterium]
MFYNELLLCNVSAFHLRYVRSFAVEKIADILQAKGMNPEKAIVHSRGVFGEEIERANLFFHNLNNYFGAEIIQRVYGYIAHKALLKETMALNSYDQVLGMMQQVYSSVLSESELRAIRQIAQASRYEISLVR